MKKIIHLFIFIFIFHQGISKHLINKNIPSNRNININEAIKDFCFGKSTNFCSKEHLALIIKIQAVNDEKFKMERKLKLYNNELSKKIFENKKYRFLKDFFSVRFK